MAWFRIGGKLQADLFSFQAKGEKADYVRITQSGGELLVEIFKDKRLVAKRQIPYNVDECKDGFLETEVPEDDIFFLGCTWDSYKITKAADNALDIRYESGAVGVYFIPIAGVQWVWYRFPSISNQ